MVDINALQAKNVLSRPPVNLTEIADGAYKGTIVYASFEQKEDKFNGGLRNTLVNKIQVRNDEGEIVDLYMYSNYSWSNRGNMVKLLEKLKCLPEPGEEISLDELVGLPVQVIVENVEKDGKRYPNIASIKRIGDKKATVKQQPPAQKVSKADKEELEKEMSEDTETDLDLEEDFNDDLDDLE